MREPAPVRLPVEDDVSGPVILKDGSAAIVRPARVDDVPEVMAFVHGMSPEHRSQRFPGQTEPLEPELRALCQSSDPREAMSLVAVRRAGGRDRIVGLGSYARLDADGAAVSFAVADGYHDRGFATTLLDRLGAIARAAGFRRFRATTREGNVEMFDVFAHSGLLMTSTRRQGMVEVELMLAPSRQAVAAAEARERSSAAASIAPLFRPRGIAVVGVSRRESGIGRRIFEALVASGYGGGLYPVNPAGGLVAGHRMLARVADAGGPIDLAVVAVPREHVLPAIDDCATAGVRAVIVITAGYAEAGAEGREAQLALLDRVRASGMRLIGPNCLGALSACRDVRFNASFSPVMPPPGRLAFSSQSGAVGIVLLALARSRGVGLSNFVSVGNKADVSGNDLLQFWEDDPHTSVIALYLESFGNPRRFARIAQRVARTKPIIAVKSGRTSAGARAAGSHTAALAAGDRAVSALFAQTGVIRAGTIDELFDIAACLETQPLPAGRRLAIVTNAGGPGILAADACAAAGLIIEPFSGETQARLRAILPAAASVVNPVDMIASAGPSQFASVIETVMRAPDVDAVLVLHTSVDMTSGDLIARAIEAGVATGRVDRPTVPVVACLMAERAPAMLQAGSERVPVYPFPENAIRALGHAARYVQWRDRPPGVRWTFDDLLPESAMSVVSGAIAARNGGWLTAEEVGRVLAAFGIVLTPAVCAKTAEDAADTAAAMGFPVVAKLSAPGLIHKTEAQGVVAGLSSCAAVRQAFDRLMTRGVEQDRHPDGIVIQSMMPGIETMVGVARDPALGPMIGFGLGGTNVELIGDVAFRLAPLTDRDVRELIDETRASTLLRGYRGRPPGDRAALTELLLRVSCLVEAIPEIAELDFNPVIVGVPGAGCHIVDARMRVSAA